VQDKGLVGVNLNVPCEIGLFFGWINVRVLVVLERSEEPVKAHIDTGRLHHRGVEWIKDDAASVDFTANIAVREEHDDTLTRVVVDSLLGRR
jgi:hypothetical protein